MAITPILTTIISTLVTRNLFESVTTIPKRWVIRLIIALLLQVLFAVVPIINTANWWIIIPIIAINIIDIILISTINRVNLSRLLSFSAALIILVPIIGDPHIVPGYNSFCTGLVNRAAQSNTLLSAVTPEVFHYMVVMLVGLWIAGIETNYPIALILKRSGLMPEDGQKKAPGGGPPGQVPADIVSEPARGRMIGILERMIVLVLTLTGNLSALGLVLAAKAFARFKDMDKRDFAEYVLIGTLLSISASIIVGLFLKPLI